MTGWDSLEWTAHKKKNTFENVLGDQILKCKRNFMHEKTVTFHYRKGKSETKTQNGHGRAVLGLWRDMEMSGFSS